MTDDQELVSLSGAPIWNHQERTKPFEIAIGEKETLEEISEHIERHVGPIQMVWHEVLSIKSQAPIWYFPPSSSELWNCGKPGTPLKTC